MQPVLEVELLAVERPGGVRVTLDSLQLCEGEAVALFGPSGVGKSSLLEGMFGLIEPGQGSVSGSVRLLGREFLAMPGGERRRALRSSMAWVTQDAQAALDPLQPVGDQVRQATWRTYSDIAEALTALGIEDAREFMDRLPHQISGGQAQRVLLAVATLRRPQLLVADEPSASLDEETIDLLCKQLALLRREGTAILLSTHDRRLIERLEAGVYVANSGSAFVVGDAAARAWPQRPPKMPVGELPVLSARDIVVDFGGRRILDGVDLELCRGEVVALVGESGAGKNTLARVLCGHQDPDSGRVERPSRHASVQMLCQDALASLTPGRTLRSLLSEAHGPFFDASAQAEQLALSVEVLDRSGNEMSGGERRRAALLRALAVNPDVLLLDEPTASLDHETSVAVLKMLLQLRDERGVALLLITHDRELAAAVASRTVELVGGQAT